MSTDWIDRYCDAWNRHDAAGVAAFFTQDGVYVDTSIGFRGEGPEAISSFVLSAVEEFSTDFQFFKASNSAATETDYAFEWIMKGAHDRPDANLGLPATGMAFEILGVSIGRLDAGRIKEHRDYWNVAAFLRQVGLMPGPARPTT